MLTHHLLLFQFLSIWKYFQIPSSKLLTSAGNALVQDLIYLHGFLVDTFVYMINICSHALEIFQMKFRHQPSESLLFNHHNPMFSLVMRYRILLQFSFPLELKIVSHNPLTVAQKSNNHLEATLYKIESQDVIPPTTSLKSGTHSKTLSKKKKIFATLLWSIFAFVALRGYEQPRMTTSIVNAYPLSSVLSSVSWFPGQNFHFNILLFM